MTALAGTTARLPTATFRAPPVGRTDARVRTFMPGEGAVVFAGSLAIYLVLAALLVFGMNSIEGDAWSRVGNAFYMLYSRDPHLAAIGFVWTPLPSFAVVPLLPLKALWPALVEQGFASNIVSALCMAGAVYQVRAILLELGLSRAITLVLTVLFALHPMVLVYAANGMSEAMFLFFALAAVRALMKWAATQHSAALVHGGIALALLYLTRYEGIAVAAGATIFVLGHGYVRARGDIRQRSTAAIADAVVLGVPVAFAVALWAVTSLIIVGSPFETFTSIYGSTSQLNLSAQDIQNATGQGTPAATGFMVRQIAGLEPAGLLVAAGALVAVVRRYPQALVPVALLGVGLVFSIWTFLTGRSFGWLRFYILVVPLATIAAGTVIAQLRRPPFRRRAFGKAIKFWAMTAVVALVALGLPSGLAVMGDDRLGREETDKVRWFTGSAEPWSGPTLGRQAQERAALDVADYLDQLALAPGSVLIDVATGFPVVLQSKNPEQFVITPDRDFHAAVADPAAFAVRYVVVAPAVGYASLNAIEREHPGMYLTGAGIADLAGEFGEGIASWRLYRVRGVP
jgi:Dolichyl-phosphate-mannose-protein mannosyltransferase